MLFRSQAAAVIMQVKGVEPGAGSGPILCELRLEEVVRPAVDIKDIGSWCRAGVGRGVPDQGCRVTAGKLKGQLLVARTQDIGLPRGAGIYCWMSWRAF